MGQLSLRRLKLSTETENALIELHKTLSDDLQTLIDNETDTQSQLTFTSCHRRSGSL